MIKLLIAWVRHLLLWTKVECYDCGRMHEITREAKRKEWSGYEGWICAPCAYAYEMGEAYDREMEAKLMEWEHTQVRFREIRVAPMEIEAMLNKAWEDPDQEVDEITMRDERITQLDSRLRDDELTCTQERCCEFNFDGHGDMSIGEDEHAPDPAFYYEPVDQRTWTHVRAS